MPVSISLYDHNVYSIEEKVDYTQCQSIQYLSIIQQKLGLSASF